ncbi:PAS domain S-box protein [Candidatus Bipolaricaulota bacterium]|nr:PAS domain S-box protein [Candidatus Bipolaricaulota bacterium]
MRRNDGSGEHERLVGLGKDFWSLFEGLGDAAYLIETSTGKILAANAQAAAQTGYSTDELVGMNIVDDLSVDPPPVSLEEVGKRFSRGKTVRFVHKKRRKDGSIYWDEVTVAPLPFPGIHVSLNRGPPPVSWDSRFVEPRHHRANKQGKVHSTGAEPASRHLRQHQCNYLCR